jgi:hypothetical protein
LPGASGEVVGNYPREAMDNPIPKIRKNYKVAISVYYVEQQRIQLLPPLFSAESSSDISRFLADRDDATRTIPSGADFGQKH